MALSAGSRLGSYEVLAPLGKGGMGEVYRAKDTKLNREVAIKVLPAALARDPERLARFEREAKALAALNHPGIAQIYAVEEVDGIRALVMELVPGRTLQGPLPLAEALGIARQIADALQAAHDKGIVHRDLKPANIMLTPSGAVKVLDFGLAKLTERGAAKGDGGHGSDSPTLTIGATQAGMVMGTAAYMAPEQARGQDDVDRRADIWAFGVVLHELLTGQRLFHGGTISDILAAVLKVEPDVSAAPARVRPLLERCLQKEPAKRLQAVGDWELLVGETKQAAPSRSRFGGGGWVAAGTLAVAAAALGFGLYRATRPAELKPLVRLDVDLGAGVSLTSPSGASTILSPDGSRLVYVSQGKLFTRRLDQPKVSELAGTEGASSPFFSPDGRWVAFFAGGKLKKVSVEGGSAVVLCDAASGVGGSSGSWGEDGNIIATLGAASPLSRVSAAGGAPVPVTEFGPGELTHRWPQILPGGKAVLFTANNKGFYGFDDSTIEVMSLADHRRKTLVRGGTFGRYSPSGHVLYINKGTLFAVPFDLDRLDVRGTPSPVLDQVAYSNLSGSAQYDFSRDGTLLYENGGETGGGLLPVQWMDAAGKMQRLLNKADHYFYPRLSPDGTRLALSAEDIWVYDWQRDIMTRLSFSGGVTAPVWSPDGRYIVFRGAQGMFWSRSDGAGKPQPLTQSKNTQVPYSITPDGKRLAFHEVSGSGIRLWTLPLENNGAGLRAGKPELFEEAQFNERSPYFSPDGRWLAYASEESGTYQVYVRAFSDKSRPDKGGKWQISNGGGLYPVFSRTGRELFFRGPDNRIMMTEYAAKGDSFAADKPRVWSEKKIADTGLNGSAFDVAPDGKRIAALMPVETPDAQQSQSHTIFLLNFFDELRRKAPVGK